MGLRGRARQVLGPVIGAERTERLRTAERALRRRMAQRVDAGAVRGASARGPRGEWQPADPFARFPRPSHTVHQVLAGLHQRLRPATYLEVGVRWGDSLTLSRCVSVGIDPDFKISHELHAPIHLERTTSDEFFAREDPLAVFAGRPVDLAFIDGMHLAEFALRDFMNIERHMAPGGVVVFDDVLPRNSLEAARERKTKAWTGDVYKVVDILREHRPDLTLLPVNSRPTGALVVLGVDPQSTVLADIYDSLVPRLEAADPQEVPEDLLRRTSAVEASVLLDSVDWETLVALRSAPVEDPRLRGFVALLADLPTVGGAARTGLT